VHRVLVFISILLLAGCASYPKSAAVSDFADAATKATALLEDAGKIEALLAERIGYERAVIEYVVGHGRRTIDFPPQSLPLFKKERIAARVAVLKAIGEYAKAIGELNDPERPKKVGLAIGKIGSSLAGFATSASPDLDAAAVAPTLGIISSVAAFFASQQSAIAIRETADAAHPAIARAAELLDHDFVDLNGRFGRRLEGLRRLQTLKIRVIRDDPKVTSIELEKRYQDLLENYREIQTRVVALRKSSDILAGLVQAHDDLRRSDDSERAIAAFKELVEAIALNSQELRKIGASSART
jgi:hypothetical protein